MNPVNLVALKARREQAIALVSQRYADGVLDEDELDDRLERAERATQEAELIALIADLDPPSEPTALVPLDRPPTQDLVCAGELPSSRQVVSVLSSRELRGAWMPGRETTIFNVLGTTTLDLREALPASGEVELRVRVVLGDVIVIVPPETRVTVDATPILGDLKHDEESSVDLHGPHVRVTGIIVLGDVKIRVQRPGESWRETKKRRKLAARERKLQLKAGRRS